MVQHIFFMVRAVDYIVEADEYIRCGSVLSGTPP
jgi:hypothetical protein